MTSTVLGRVPAARISARARDVHPGRVLAAVIAGLLFGAGWAVCKVLSAAWYAVAWCGVAAAEGWGAARDDGGVRRGPAGPG